MKVLLVDDHPILLEGLQHLLESKGIHVAATARDGLEAVALARDLKPDVILMDIRMPVCDGLAATRLIKAEMPEAKIVILTASTEDQDLFEAIKSGAYGYLIKNVETSELLEALDQVRQGFPPFSPGLAAKLLGEFMHLAESAPAEPLIKKVKSAGYASRRGLSPRRAEVLNLIAQGLTYKEVGAQLGLSPRTIKYHMSESIRQLHLQNRAQVLAYAGRLGAGYYMTA